jgi:hypothetical protein
MECVFCKDNFSTKGNLTRHLRNKKCKSPLLDDWVLLHEFIQQLAPNHEHQVPLAVPEINDIKSLNLSYLTPDRIKPLLDRYDINLLEEYIYDIIYNKEHPENHIVKYNTRYPQTFVYEGSVLFLDAVIRKLEAPIGDIIELHKRRCLKFYKHDTEFISDCDTRDLRFDVSKCIKRILQKILYDPEMKS